MIRNGLYAVTSQLLDGLEGGAFGVSVLQDGIMRGAALFITTRGATPALMASGRGL